jgi:uncharacterized protein YoaH (UPF0181 family)
MTRIDKAIRAAGELRASGRSWGLAIHIAAEDYRLSRRQLAQALHRRKGNNE